MGEQCTEQINRSQGKPSAAQSAADKKAGDGKVLTHTYCYFLTTFSFAFERNILMYSLRLVSMKSEDAGFFQQLPIAFISQNRSPPPGRRRLHRLPLAQEPVSLLLPT